MKATDSQLLSSYAATKSVWKTAEAFGMCGQSVHERLARLGVIEKPEFTEDEREAIRTLYTTGFRRGDGALDKLSVVIGHHKTNICRVARSMGLTGAVRHMAPCRVAKLASACKSHRAANGHPKGMKGKAHSLKNKSIISANSKKVWKDKSPEERSAITLKQMKTTFRNGSRNTISRANATWKAGWREVGGIRFYARSRWEANYARYLQFLKEKGQIAQWEHEPETFWFETIKRGCRSYLPDFRVTLLNGSVEYHEVKGWMDARSVTKIKRMKKYHPKITLLVLDGKWYRANSPTLRGIIKDWEHDK